MAGIPAVHDVRTSLKQFRYPAGKSSASLQSSKDPSTPGGRYPTGHRLATILSAPAGSESLTEAFASTAVQLPVAPLVPLNTAPVHDSKQASSDLDRSLEAPSEAPVAANSSATGVKKGHRRGRSLSGLIPSLKMKPKRSASVLDAVRYLFIVCFLDTSAHPACRQYKVAALIPAVLKCSTCITSLEYGFTLGSCILPSLCSGTAGCSSEVRCLCA